MVTSHSLQLPMDALLNTLQTPLMPAILLGCCRNHLRPTSDGFDLPGPTYHCVNMDGYIGSQ